MFLLAGSGTDYDDKKNGRKLKSICPNCKVETNFVEQIKTEYIHLFFIPILSSEDENSPKNIFRCQKCQNCYTINQEIKSNPIDEAKRKMDEMLAKKRQEDEKKQKIKKIDDELLEMKKKLGKL
jgi:hypothetical protein